VVAVRVRTSVGRPGSSAQARWRQLRTAERTTWTRTLPWRLAVILGIGAAGGLLGNLIHPKMSLISADWRPWRPAGHCGSDPAPRPRPGGGGRRGSGAPPACLAPLERHGRAVLHDLVVPGNRANLDHVVIGPGGVFVIDSKQYRGRLQVDAVWEAVAWPLSPGPRPTRAWWWCPSWPSMAPRSPGQGRHRGRARRVGPAPAQHALPAPGRAGARAGRLAGRPGPGPLPPPPASR
jgi:hypothetical protein